MRTQKTMYVLFAGMFLFFANTGVALAQDWDPSGLSCDVPTWCEVPIGKKGYIWGFELVSGPELTTLACGDDDPDADCYEYQYRVTPPTETPNAPISQVLFALSNNCELRVGGANQYFAPGVGEPSGIGEGIHNAFIARFPPDGDLVTFTSNVGTLGLTTMILYSSNDVGSCAIAGPDPNGSDPNEILTLSSTEYITTWDAQNQESKVFRVVRDGITQCITDARECYTAMCEGDEGDDPLTDDYRQLTSVPIEDALKYQPEGADLIGVRWEGDTNQKCNEAIVKANPWVWVSGRRVWR